MSDLPAFLAPVLEDLSSLRSSTNRRVRALRAIDGLLATLCLPKPDELPADQLERERIASVFVGLQDDVAYNVVSRLTPLAGRLLPILHSQLLHHAPAREVETTVGELSATFLVVQGMALLHPASKDLVGANRSSMEMILDLLLLTRHFPPPLSSFSPNPSSEAPTDPPTPQPSSPPLAAVLLDTLFCVLVDAPRGVRTFEDAGGLDIVRKVLKSKNVVKEVRIKCLEFLLFYLLPEGSDDPTASLASLLPSSSSTGASPDPSAASPLLAQRPTSPIKPLHAAPPPASQPGASPVPRSSFAPGSSSSTPRGTPSRAGHRRSESATSGHSSAGAAGACDGPFPNLNAASGAVDDSPRRARSRQTTRESSDPADLAALISRARATPGRSSSAAVPPRPPASPTAALSHSTAAVPLSSGARRPTFDTRSASHAPQTPSSSAAKHHRALGLGLARPPSAMRAGSPSPHSRTTSSPTCSRAASPTAAAPAPAAVPHAQSRQALIDAFLQTPQKPSHPRDVFGGPPPQQDVRTPSRYRLAEDAVDVADEGQLAVPPLLRGGSNARLLPTPRRPSTHASAPGPTRLAGRYPSPKAQVVEPRANGPMLPPPYVPSRARRASSSGGLRASRSSSSSTAARGDGGGASAGKQRQAHSASTPVEATLGHPRSSTHVARPSFFDPPLPLRRDARVPSPHRSTGRSPARVLPGNDSGPIEERPRHQRQQQQQLPNPSPRLALPTAAAPPSSSASSTAQSPSLTLSSSNSPTSTPCTSPDPFTLARPPLPTLNPPTSPGTGGGGGGGGGKSPAELRASHAKVLGDVQAFVLSPSSSGVARGRRAIGDEGAGGGVGRRREVAVGLGFEM